MEETRRYLTIVFNDGSKTVIDFPKQVDDPQLVVARLKESIKANQIMLEVDGALMVIPLTSVKYIHAYPAPDKLPETAIRGATLVTQE